MMKSNLIFVSVIAAVAMAQQKPPVSGKTGPANINGTLPDLSGLGDQFADALKQGMELLQCFPSDVQDCSAKAVPCANDDKKCACSNVNKLYDTCFAKDKLGKSDKCKTIEATVDKMRSESVAECKKEGYETDTAGSSSGDQKNGASGMAVGVTSLAGALIMLFN